MTKISRREFLRLAALGVSGATLNHFLTGCTPQSSTPEPATDPSLPTVAAKAPESANATPAANSAANLPAGVPDLVVARNGDPESLVRRAIAALGGMERFVQPGARVIVKPNICTDNHSYEYAATTNPWVVGALVKMALEAGARSVRVMDYPFGGTAESAYARSGIQEQVQAAGGEMVAMTGFKYITTDIPAGSALKKTDVYDEILAANVLIDVPVAKHHSMARLTLGMKNLMGVIRNRSALHRNLGQSIADLTSLVRPHLTVIDAVRILMANGPTGGSLNDVKQLDTIVASPDIVAADSYAASFFGLQPADLAYIQAGSALGLGRSDLSNLKIEELSS